MFEPLPNVIRLRRKQRNLTLEALSKMAGVSRRQLWLLEEGHNVSLKFLLKVARALELTELPIAELRLRAAPPDLATLVIAADAVATANRALKGLADVAVQLDEASTSIGALVNRALRPVGSGEAIAAAAERLGQLPPEEAVHVAATLRELAQAPDTTHRAARAKRADTAPAKSVAATAARRRTR
jgi:transcriptional regulator with XRE-family HTH domain